MDAKIYRPSQEKEKPFEALQAGTNTTFTSSAKVFDKDIIFTSTRTHETTRTYPGSLGCTIFQHQKQSLEFVFFSSF